MNAHFHALRAPLFVTIKEHSKRSISNKRKSALSDSTF